MFPLSVDQSMRKHDYGTAVVLYSETAVLVLSTVIRWAPDIKKTTE